MIHRPLILSLDADPMYKKVYDVVFRDLGFLSVCFAEKEAFLNGTNSTHASIYLIALSEERLEEELELIREIKSNPKNTVPLIAVSTLPGTTVITRAMEAGADDFIRRPLSRNLLISKLSRFMNPEVLSHVEPYRSEPNPVELPTSISFEVELEKVDSDGIRLRSKCFIPIGTTLRLKSDLLNQSLPRLGENTLYVVNCYYEEYDKNYVTLVKTALD